MKKQLLNSLLILGFILNSYQSKAQNLIAGDIAIIGVNEDSGPVGTEDHSFTWIALRDIPSGEVIYFTEQGVDINSMTWFGNIEGHYSWTAPLAGLPCGSIVHIYEDGASSEVLVALGGGTMSGVLSGSGWNLSSGDQVLAYQATSVQPAIGSATFITGIHLNDDLTDGETNGWTSTTYNGTGVAQCHLPPGLTNGVNCISLYSPSSPENDNNKYTGTLTGTSTALRALINSPFTSGNWSGDNGSVATVGISVSDYSASVTCMAPAPTVTSVAVPADATYMTSNNLDFTVNFDKNITVNTSGGTPQISITIGTTTNQATYTSGSGTSALLFRYTIQSGDLDADGIAVGALTANGGTLQDSSGNDANLTLNSVGSTTNVLVDASLGIENNENESKFLIFPNPSNINMKIKSSLGGDFQIINQLGQTVKAFKTNVNIEATIYVGDLSEGLYFIKSANNNNVQKLIIKR